MAYGFVTADPAAWATALAKYRTAHTAYTSLPDGLAKSAADDALEDLVVTESALLYLHSPDLSAVIAKLEVLWGEGDLFADTQAAEQRRMVIGDLRRISVLQL
jgi:hypothetical protein